MIRPDISKLNQNRSIFLKIGLIIALASTIYAFNYTIYEYEEVVRMEVLDQDIEDIPIVRTAHEKKRQLPPPKIEEIIAPLELEEPEFMEEPEPVPTEILVDKNIEPIMAKESNIPSESTPAPPPVVLPEDPVEIPDFWKRVEYMPEFGDCSKGNNAREREDLSTKNLLKFIYKHIKYPAVALENGVEGKVILRFIVDQEGKVIDPKILRSPGAGLGKEALRVIRLLPIWKPGQQGSNNVKVQYTIPINFRAM